MKRSFLLSQIIILFVFVQAQAQTITGQIKTVSDQQLSYVNIGIVGTSIGTVSDDEGNFVLYLSDKIQRNDTVCMSRIGYKSQYFRLENIASPMMVNLEQDVFDLAEIIVKPTFSNTKITGRKKVRGKNNVNFSIAKKPRQNLGAEIGKKFKVKRNKTTQIESLRFYIRANDFEEVKFRLLFYTVKRGNPNKHISDKDIIITIANKQTGWVEVDLSEYEILTTENFIASLQWIDASEKGRRLAMPINLPVLGSHHYYKFGSQAKWKHFRNMSTTMNVTLAY